VLWGPFAFVGNDARDRRRNSGIARRPPRFRSLVQNFLSIPLHAITILEPILEGKTELKAKRRLQIDAAI
jgi:hypothetical protein